MNKEAWLIFRNGSHKLQPFLKNGFGHVGVLYKDEFNWLLVSPNDYDLEIMVLPYKVTDNAPQWLANSLEMKVLKVTYTSEIKKKMFPRFLVGFTCVSFVKYFLGYKDWRLTPYGLYKNLHKCKKNIINTEELICQAAKDHLQKSSN